MKALTWLAVLVGVLVVGCATTPKTDPYPIKQFVDPVTHEVPNVRTK